MATSTFLAKVSGASAKKEGLFDNDKLRYALRSIFAGVFLTLTTAGGAIAADVINKALPGTGRFIFPAFFAWGLAYIVFLNSELVTSNMMFLTSASLLKKIKWSKAFLILFYCTFFNLVGAVLAGYLFGHSAAFQTLTKDSYIVQVVTAKLARPNELVLLEGVLANVFVNIAILSFLLVKDSSARLFLVLSAIYMFVFLGNEHIAANFSSFAILKFNPAGSFVTGFDWGNILRHWSVTWIANYIGGGFLIGAAYTYLNLHQDIYVDE